MYRVDFLDLPVDLFDIKDIDKIKAGTKIFSLNAEQVILANDNNAFQDIIKSFELVIPDGSGVVLGLKLLLNKKNYKEKIVFRDDFSEKITENTNNFDEKLELSDLKKQINKVAGVELAQMFLEKKKRIAILGSTDDVIKKLRENYCEKLVFAHHGFYKSEEEKTIVNQIVDSSPEILLVGMGAPKQEEFIFKYKNEFENMIAMGVGGSLDVLSGKCFRAPKIFLKLDLEWFYRLVLEPFRIKRILNRVPRFVLLLLCKLLKS